MNKTVRTQSSNGAGQGNGAVWYRLHSEREQICKALLNDSRPRCERQAEGFGMSKEYSDSTLRWHRELLQARLGKVDDALDRLMAGSYGNCSKCGRWIEDTKLDFDPAIALCIECWQRGQTNH